MNNIEKETLKKIYELFLPYSDVCVLKGIIDNELTVILRDYLHLSNDLEKDMDWDNF